MQHLVEIQDSLETQSNTQFQVNYKFYHLQTGTKNIESTKYNVHDIFRDLEDCELS